jgi:tetratricopeptide (TPR) repeat protein
MKKISLLSFCGAMASLQLSLVGLACASAANDHPSATQDKPITLITGLGNHHHPVSSANPDAQKFFDQGIAFLYAFNHDEAVRSFRRAAELDPKLAMAHWGMALAQGSNYNLKAEPAQLTAALESLRMAQTLAKAAPEEEQAYIDALTKRYSDDPKADVQKLALDYKNAMGALTRRYPDDLDAATLYAESAMNLRPWQLWGPGGQPAEGTEEIVAVLESVLKRNPDHLGANHYYIHAVEASSHPEKALPSARRLETLAPAAGHLVHMPGHVYIRTGDYESAARQNELAIVADKITLGNGVRPGIYAIMYYNHNFHFLAVARALQGRYADAREAADQLVRNVEPHVKDMPPLEGFLPTSALIRVYFRRWDEVLKMEAPAPNLQVTAALWRFSRGMAYAAAGKVPEAEKEREAFQDLVKGVPLDAPFGDQNKAHSVFAIAGDILKAKIALTRGDKATAIGLLQAAAKGEDALSYIEPPAWYLPARDYLGGALMAKGDYAEAEKIFREELAHHPRSGRALFGLWQSLKAQKKSYDARLVEQEFRVAWKNADTNFQVEDF